MSIHSILPETITPESVFLIIALSGILIGHLFHKYKLPDITGQVLLGLLIGPSGYLIFQHIFNKEICIISNHSLHSISFFSELALGVMTFNIGSQLNLKTLHNAGKRILTLTIFDALFTFSFVFISIFFLLRYNFTTASLLAAIAIATAPGTIISLIQKKYARGVFTKTLLAVVALNNFITISTFVFAKTISKALLSDVSEFHIGVLYTPIEELIVTIIVGVIMGFLISLTTNRLQGQKTELFTIVFLSIFANIIICRYFEISALLVNLIMGSIYTNKTHHIKEVNKTFSQLTPTLFAIFFTLAGAHLDLSNLASAGIAGATFIIARSLGKFLAPKIASKIYRFPKSISDYLGIALLPQAGLAIGLVISLNKFEEFRELAPIISTIVLAAVAINEIIGPFTVSKSFDATGETGQATPRLIDFLHEEFILTQLDANDKWEAIEIMSSFLEKTNHLKSITHTDLLDWVIKRERQFTTALGAKLAVPHAKIPAKEHLMGVIGISQKPINWDAPDGKGVQVVIMVATPEGLENLHIQLLGAISQIFATDSTITNRLVGAKTPAEVYEILQSKEIKSINTVLSEL